MPGYLLHVGATMQCPHGGQITAIPSNFRVSVGQQPVATVSDQFLVAGCGFMLLGKPSPCFRVTWMSGANRVTVGGRPPLVTSSSGICMSADGIAQGPPLIVMTQVRAEGA